MKRIRTIYYSLPYGFSLALTKRISFLLASREPDEARIAARAGILVGFLIVCISTGTVFALGSQAGYLFTGDESTIGRMRSAFLSINRSCGHCLTFSSNRDIAPLVAVFQLLFGAQALAQGILRSVGKNWEITGSEHNALTFMLQVFVIVMIFFSYSFLAMWVIGVPMAMYFVFVARPSFDLVGLWAGLLTGLLY